MRLSDYIVDYLATIGVKDIFFVPGYGSMHLNDALARNKNVNAVSVHHEQSAAMAALSYAKYNCNLGACFVTTGCGGTNAITGLLHAFQDSVPCIFISGQIDTKHIISSFDVKLRQVGKQEADIISIVKSVTKYAVTVRDAQEIAYQFGKALYIAKAGRPGPVWLDIPLDIQAAQIDKEKLTNFYPDYEIVNYATLTAKTRALVDDLKNSKRPIVLAGNGVRMSNSLGEFRDFVHNYKLPVVVSKMAVDVLDTTDPLSLGAVGTQSGSRHGNFALANSDLVIVMGCRLSINITGNDYKNFAREAKIVVVDIDIEEHSKNTVHIDDFIHADLKTFLSEINKINLIVERNEWLEKCSHWKKIFPFISEEERNSDRIDLFLFNERMSMAAPKDTVIVSDAGNVCFTTPASIIISDGKRSITSGAQAEMGYSLPGSIGVCYASDLKEVACVTGDGSIMMNIQELATVAFRKLPIKIFVINNNGYACIRKMQNDAYKGRTIGTDQSNGLGIPSFEKVAYCFDLRYVKISRVSELDDKLREIFSIDGPVLCEVLCVTEQKNFIVSMGKDLSGRLSLRPLEDLSPFLDREVFIKEMIIDPI